MNLCKTGRRVHGHCCLCQLHPRHDRGQTKDSDFIPRMATIQKSGKVQEQAVAIQRKYCTDAAARYDSMHAHEGGTDASIAKFIYALAAMPEVRTILDVGTATGATVRDLKCAMPGVFVCVEPVGVLVQQAVRNGVTASGPVVQATGEALPFASASFEAVCEFPTLHHAANPSAVVNEMLRVARKAVFICDSNRFGQGS
jgi:ubiquinone/menaquinone biosynthesis C-methylase UbiE